MHPILNGWLVSIVLALFRIDTTNRKETLSAGLMGNPVGMSKKKNSTPPVCDYEGSDYQESFWDRGDRAYEDQVEAVALSRMLPSVGDLLLEVGAGAGRNTPRYQGFKRVVVMDYSLTQLQQAQERLGKRNKYVYVAADVYRLPFVSGLFDASTMIRVLHHMVEPLHALHQVRRVLKPGAVFILEFANKQNLKAIFRYFLRQQSWNPFSQEAVEFAPLNYDFHPAAVRGWLKSAGFDLQRQLTVSHFRINFLKKILPLGLLVGMDALAQYTGGLWQLTPSVFTRSIAQGDTPVNERLKYTENSGNQNFVQFFRCLVCDNSGLVEAQGGLVCPTCGHSWSNRDGIYDFIKPTFQ